jgi:hypothetical protein
MRDFPRWHDKNIEQKLAPLYTPCASPRGATRDQIDDRRTTTVAFAFVQLALIGVESNKLATGKGGSQ